MINITQQEIKDILERSKTNKDLFNWCESYKQWVSENVHKCVSSEIDYIIKKSYEDNEAPLSYEDLDLFSIDNAIENLTYKHEQGDINLIQYANETHNRKCKNNGDVEVFLKSLDKDELKQIYNDLSLDDNEVMTGVYEWWVIGDQLSYRLEKQGEIILNGFWGRTCTGQSISLDYSVIQSFLSMLEDWKQ